MLSHFKKATRTLLLSGILMLPLLAAAQKMDKSKIDKFTNDTTFFTTTEKVASNTSGLSSLEVIEAYTANLHGVITLHLKVEFSAVDHRRFSITEGSNVIFKLGDNTNLTIPVMKGVDAEKEHIGSKFTGWACWTAEIAVNVIQDDIKKVTASGITAIRIPCDLGNLDFDVKPKFAPVLKNMLVMIQTPK